MADTHIGWPMYFAAKPLDAKKVKLKAGEPFPWQDKAIIRGLSKAYEFPQGANSLFSFADLPFVRVLDVGTVQMAQQILERGLTFDQAKKLLDPRGHRNGD